MIRLSRSIQPDDGAIRCVSFSPDGRGLAAGGDRSGHLFDAASGRRTWKLEGHAEAVHDVAYSADGKLLASASQDHTLRVWEVETGKLLGVLSGHPNSVTGAVFGGAGRVVSCCLDQLLIWDLKTGLWDYKVRTPSRPPIRIARSPDGKHLAVSHASGTGILYEVEEFGIRPRPLLRHDEKSAVYSVSFSQDSRRLVSAGGDGTVRVWSVETCEPLLSLRVPAAGGVVRAAHFTPDGARILGASEAGALHLWDPAREGPPATVEGPGRGVRALAMSPDGRAAATSGEDGLVRLWEL